ncbi:hypothetical protein BLNAU_11979 [Blattamonas nauphoetae]|uniref:Uncharacterized protein n=1 Tax=Blattamonas nauphoetae TaxID=2049346 RepID=A0ABQ9XRR5_9EUKA|nr:hypothetical protein BLNAU_11979 [Blattamonas nauphoetae]
MKTSLLFWDDTVPFRTLLLCVNVIADTERISAVTFMMDVSENVDSIKERLLDDNPPLISIQTQARSRSHNHFAVLCHLVSSLCHCLVFLQFVSTIPQVRSRRANTNVHIPRFLCSSRNATRSAQFHVPGIERLRVCAKTVLSFVPSSVSVHSSRSAAAADVEWSVRRKPDCHVECVSLLFHRLVPNDAQMAREGVAAVISQAEQFHPSKILTFHLAQSEIGHCDNLGVV